MNRFSTLYLAFLSDVQINHVSFYRSNESVSTENDVICNCTKDGTFGPLCEYELMTAKESFEKTLEYQLTLKFNHRLGSQLYGNITCYKTSFECDYGSLCLSWGHICDGKKKHCIFYVKKIV